MKEQENINYNRLAEAIDYIKTNFKEQPSLNEVAEKGHLSPFHFQRLFTDWAGISPKKFMQYISVEYAKQLLKDRKAILFDTAHETGFSGTGRLHDLFINVEGMTPGEYKNGGAKLNINYSFAESPFGDLIVASTPKGICHMAFIDNEVLSLDHLKTRFPNATYRRMLDKNQQDGIFIFHNDWSRLDKIKLHLNGTPFQLKVWETLLKVPKGQLTTYGAIARDMETPKASRAVGMAIGHNPVAFLIPCHRVIQSTGKLGGYMWGTTRKTAIIGWEAAQVETSNNNAS